MRVSLIPSLRRRNDALYGITRALRSVLIATGSLLLAISVIAPAPPAQAANPSDGFNPGNIISDANFYDGGSMSVTEVQQFLNRQVPNCWLGRPGYEIGKPVQWGGPTKLASKCLKDFRINTTTQVADAYCAAIPGIRNESAASVIVRVSQACGISPKVLLVMLDKEQSLVSDPWPNENQYFLAMGYACPDSGPGNTANCDPSRGGFAKQVYRAAWQFKVYKALSNSYRYKPFQNNYIQWHPNASCGGSTVHIENYATAGLYIYTPYRPNQAALNAGWGEGNACSSYGNRNFYNFYKAWFGTPSITVHDRFTGLFGSLKSTLGDVTANAVDIAGGLRQELEKGTMFWHPAVGAYAVKGGIKTYFDSLGGVTGQLGFPRTREYSVSGGYYQEFQNGIVSYASSKTRFVVKGSIRAHFLGIGGFDKAGFARGPERRVGQGYYQEFDRGWVTSLNGYGRAFVTGDLLQSYKAQGGPASLGYPSSSAKSSQEGQWQEFQSATLFQAKSGKVIPVRGSIRKYQAVAGGVGATGFPLKAERKMADGTWVQEFAKGTIYWKYPNGKFESLRAQPFHSPPVEPDTDTLASDSIPDQVDTAPQGDEESAQVEPPAQEDSIVEG